MKPVVWMIVGLFALIVFGMVFGARPVDGCTSSVTGQRLPNCPLPHK